MEIKFDRIDLCDSDSEGRFYNIVVKVYPNDSKYNQFDMFFDISNGSYFNAWFIYDTENKTIHPYNYNNNNIHYEINKFVDNEGYSCILEGDLSKCFFGEIIEFLNTPSLVTDEIRNNLFKDIEKAIIDCQI